ncbi:hypothetical protein [Flagellimonas sp. 2504JD1-5]
MKVFLVTLLAPLLLLSQEESDKKMHFIALYTLGESWDMEKTPSEQIYFKEHSAFLSKMRKEKKIVLGARYADTGMIIVLEDNLDAAKEMLSQDIALQQKLFKVEIHRLNAFYKGCIE